MIETKDIKTGLAECERLAGKLAEYEEQVPLLRTEAEAAMKAADVNDADEIQRIAALTTKAAVMDKKIPALRDRLDESARALLVELEKQRSPYLQRLEAERSAWLVRISNELRKYCLVIVERDGSRRDEAEIAARQCTIFHAFIPRWPTQEIATAENASGHDGRRADAAVAAARTILELFEEWKANGKSFVNIASYNREYRVAG